MYDSEIAGEQDRITELYGHLDELRDLTAAHLEAALGEPAATAQARVERDVAVARHSDRRAALDAAENGLCFGRLDRLDGEHHYVGRIGLSDDAGDPLLIDWRAPAARPFYVATAAAPEGIARRRHIATKGRRVTGLDDEVLDAGAAGQGGLTGEAALLAAVDAGRTGRMGDIVATLQAEQDSIVRADRRGVLVVQGGPGTGKTAVALHRAAYLLYTHPSLAARGVLVVGPNATFLDYIGQVLPGLGETNVVLSTVGELFPGIDADRTESVRTAEIKGRLEMAAMVAAAVRDRQAPNHGQVEIPWGQDVLSLESVDYEAAAGRARGTLLPHNLARPVFVDAIINVLTRQLVARLEAALLDEDGMPLDGGDASGALSEADRRALVAAGFPEELLDAGDDNRALIGDDEIADLADQLRGDDTVRAALDRLWPKLTPVKLLDALFADPDRLASAAPDLTDDERAALSRPAGEGWSPADVPLLDEAAELLGEDETAELVRAERQRAQQVAYAQGVLDVMAGSGSTDFDEGEESELLTAADVLDARSLADRQEHRQAGTLAERAAADRAWAYGHVVVDEAQELSAMAWRVLMRRCPTRSMTLVGDLAQTGDAAGASSWARMLEPHVEDRWRLARLSINYRTPTEIMDAVADLLATLGTELELPRSIRRTGVPPWRIGPTDLTTTLTEHAAREALALRRTPDGGRLAVIVPDDCLAELGAVIAAELTDVSYGAAPDLTCRTVVLSVRQCKGLEFDSVLVADPAGILAGSPRGRNDLYVALTRATQRLGIVHPGAVPVELAAIQPVG